MVVASWAHLSIASSKGDKADWSSLRWRISLAFADLSVELIDQPQARLDRSLPWLREAEVREQLAAADAEQIGDGAGLAVREQHRVHPLLQAGAMPHQVQPPTCPLAFGAHARVGQPDRRHQIATRQLGEHPGVDPVGLAGQRRKSFHLLRIGDLDLPAREPSRS